MLDANYMIAALLRMLIKELSDPSADEDMKKLYVEDFKDCVKNFCEKSTDANSEQIESIKGYIDCLIQHANDSKELLTVLGPNESESESEVLENIEKETEPENDDDEKRNKFIHHVLADKKHQIGELIEMMDITLEVLNLGKEEIEKYMPSTPNTEDQKKLQNVKGNISE